MAKKKRTEPQRLLDLPVIEALSIKGWLQKDIVDHLNEIRPYKLTQQQVSYDIAQIRERWVEAATQEILESRGRVLATLRVQQEEAWRGWVRSTEPIKVTQKRITEGPQGTTKEMTERTEEGKWDKGFLDVVTANLKSYRDILGMDAPKQENIDVMMADGESQTLVLPADLIAPDFVNLYRDIKDHKHTEYLIFGGRGSTKSSFLSLAVIYLIVNNPTIHALATRQVFSTVRDSVYAQLVWAVNELGLYDSFKCTTNPLQITYLPTGQNIYFRGLDDVGKIKSLKPPFGYLGIMWQEEADQSKSAEKIRKVEQSLRGGNDMYFFKSWNPPRSAQNWINKYAKVPKKNQYQHRSNYLSVPPEWLGDAWLAEAEHLKEVNPLAYANEYLGEVTGTGGTVFSTAVLREISDAEIKTFTHEYNGLDFGFSVDPSHYVKCSYNNNQRKLYIYGEVRMWKASNEKFYKAIKKYGYNNKDLLICDSAEPRSIADLRQFGANARGSEKGAGSLRYSMRWLENLTEIVIDPVRCPYTADEFINYEFAKNSQDEYISEYVDKDDHAISAVRYALNLAYNVRGQ
jgi:PBSX family phage terminase large subunit